MRGLQDIWRRGAIGIALTAVTVALSAPVLAADMPARVVTKAPAGPLAWNWSGFYAGLNAGWGWGEKTGDRTADAGLAAVIGAVPISYGIEAQGIFGGGQIGYNWQNGTIVYGFEADFQASNIHDNQSVLLPTGAITAPSISNAEEHLRWFGTVRARLGVTPTDRALYYVTGGLAYGRVESRADVCFPLFNGVCDGFFSGSLKDTKTGWTIGGGAEYALDQNWALKIEYLYLDLGSDTLRLTDPINPGSFLDYRFEHRDHIARIGLNFRPK
jgi:outer membrane immunogenic protein